VQLLISQAKKLARLGDNGQAVVLQKAPAAVVADGASALQSMMGGEVEFGSIVVDEDQRVLAHGQARGLGMRTLDGVNGGSGGVAKAVESPEFIPVEDLGERFLRVFGDPRSGKDQTAFSSGAAKFSGAKSILGPLLRVSNECHVRTLFVISI